MATFKASFSIRMFKPLLRELTKIFSYAKGNQKQRIPKQLCFNYRREPKYTSCSSQHQIEPTGLDAVPIVPMIGYQQLLCRSQEFPTWKSPWLLKCASFQAFLPESQHFLHATTEKKH